MCDAFEFCTYPPTVFSVRLGMQCGCLFVGWLQNWEESSKSVKLVKIISVKAIDDHKE